MLTRTNIHPIALQYFDKIESAGGSVADKNTVNTFVWELSRIIHPSLWVCWPLRSSQNIGTGTTAYSLGQFGNFNGTLTSGPVWGVDGLTSTVGSGQFISTNLIHNFSRSKTLIFVGKLSATSSSSRRCFGSYGQVDTPLYLIVGSNTTNNSQIASYAGSGFVTINVGSATDISLTHNFFAASQNSLTTTNNWRGFKNSIEAVGNYNNPSVNQSLNIMAGQNAADCWTGECSFAAYIDTSLTIEQMANLRLLFKNTLGQGLGLP